MMIGGATDDEGALLTLEKKHVQMKEGLQHDDSGCMLETGRRHNLAGITRDAIGILVNTKKRSTVQIK